MPVFCFVIALSNDCTQTIYLTLWSQTELMPPLGAVDSQMKRRALNPREENKKGQEMPPSSSPFSLLDLCEMDLWGWWPSCLSAVPAGRRAGWILWAQLPCWPCLHLCSPLGCLPITSFFRSQQHKQVPCSTIFFFNFCFLALFVCLFSFLFSRLGFSVVLVPVL